MTPTHHHATSSFIHYYSLPIHHPSPLKILIMHLPLWKVSFGSDELLMSYYLFIFSYHQHVQHITSQILLILIDLDSFSGHFLI